VPLDEMERFNLNREQFDQPTLSSPAQAALLSIYEEARSNLSKPATNVTWPETLRPIWVLAALHRRLVERIARQNFSVGATRHDLGPIEKPWIAWRAARLRI